MNPVGAARVSALRSEGPRLTRQRWEGRRLHEDPVAKGVAAIMLRNKLKVPDALAQATTAGVRDPPKGFVRKDVGGNLFLVARDGAVAWRAET